ncbi:cytochrome c [uncultured Roseobacter sp.]|uniref:c-type cytochrome n=1 Tax=uncultured Roseobacter sp. TaxID=114847 RepID=UPI0026066EF5|nr:cytochrome c [uncultured Roseobacter sp.]
MKKHVNLISVVALLFAAAPSLAADVENGKKLSRQCSACHGKDGLSKDPEVPNLAGQPALYLEKSLKDYQTGAREDRRMTLIVKNLSDEDLKDLAAYFAAFEITVGAPE